MGIRAVTTEELYDHIGRVCEARAAIERAFVALADHAEQRRPDTAPLEGVAQDMHNSQMHATTALSRLIKLARQP
jgi:hypothetical protein